MKKKSNFFVEQYETCWKFLEEIQWYAVFALGIFCLMFLIGFTFPIFFRGKIFEFLAEIIKLVEGKSVVELVVFIFLNNLKAAFFAIVLGIVIGLFPFLTGIVNGYLVGFVAREVATQEGIFVLWQLFPHGIFELPAIILSIGIGLKIGVDLFKGNVKKKLRYNFVEAFRFFVFVIFPLLLIAGIIEGVLTGIF
jgi:stage II sporulation protein M